MDPHSVNLETRVSDPVRWTAGRQLPDSLLHRVRAGMRRARVQLIYVWCHGRLAALDDPRLLTEHIQRRKLFDRDPRYPLWADKVLAKQYVRERLGAWWLVPTLWRGSRLPAEPVWAMPFVVKSRHGCGHFCMVRNDADYQLARRRSAKWMRSRYGAWLDEWLYGEITPGLLVEPFIGKGRELPVDYKLFVFGGRVRYVQVHLERATNHRWMVFDLAWRRVSVASSEVDPIRPRSLGQMIAAAEALGGGFEFVRADFYEVEGQPLFGELTFYPGSGLEPLEPAELNEAMGAWWSEARLISAVEAARVSA